MVADERASSDLLARTVESQSRIDRHLSSARAALAHISANNTAAHRTHLNTRQLIKDLGAVLDGTASPTFREIRSEQPAAPSLVEQLGKLLEDGTVEPVEDVREQFENVAGDARNRTEDTVTFSNSDFFDGTHEEGSVSYVEPDGSDKQFQLSEEEAEL